MRRERHFHDLRGERFAAHHQLDLGADGRVARLDIAHCNRAIHRRAESARRDAADLRAARIENFRPLPRRCATLGQDADALTFRAVREFGSDARRTRISTALAPSLLNAPGEIGFDRRGRRVDVVAVEAQARFEAETVARPEANRRDARIGEQAFGESDDVVLVHGDLVAVLAGVARTRDVARNPGDGQCTRGHECHLRRSRREVAEHG